MLRKILPLLVSLSIFSAATAQTGGKAADFYRAGLAFKEKNMFADAVVAFRKAIALNKMYDSAYVELASINLKSSSHDSAILNLNKALSISPNMTTALMALGNMYRDYKPNYDSAIICYKAAAKTDSTNKVAYYSIAWSYNAKQEYENAIPFAIKALEIDNTYRAAYGELGHAYRRSKKYAEAIEQFKKNLAVSIVDLPIFYSGMCYTQLNDKEAALKQYEELKKINEKMAGALKREIDKMK
jgi:tetratricopeptide (TPR) repeat protein